MMSVQNDNLRFNLARAGYSSYLCCGPISFEPSSEVGGQSAQAGPGFLRTKAEQRLTDNLRGVVQAKLRILFESIPLRRGTRCTALDLREGALHDGLVSDTRAPGQSVPRMDPAPTLKTIRLPAVRIIQHRPEHGPSRYRTVPPFGGRALVRACSSIGRTPELRFGVSGDGGSTPPGLIL